MRIAPYLLLLALAGCGVPSISATDTAAPDPEEAPSLDLSSPAGLAHHDGTRFRVALTEVPVGLRLERVGRGSRLHKTAPVRAPRAEGAEALRLEHAELEERWDVTPDGFAHSFLIHDRLNGEGPMRLRVEVDGAVPYPDPSDTDVVVLDVAGTTDDLQYAGLKAWDAEGALLPTRFVVQGSAIVLEVDDTGARYPIAIDPFLERSSTWSYTSSQNFALLGRWVTTGDFNDDGYDDVAVGEPCYLATDATCPSLTTPAVGRVYAFYGSEAGLPSTPSWSSSPSGQAGQQLGMSVAALDVNGDGFDDLAAGAPGFDEGFSNEGAVFLFVGGHDGLVETPTTLVTGDVESAGIGEFVTNLGYINGDTREDLFISGSSSGTARVHLGHATGLEPAPFWQVTNASEALGYNASVWDHNCDGLPDLAVTSLKWDYVAPNPANSVTDAGSVDLYTNVGGTLPLTPSQRISRPITGRTLLRIAAVADINDDGCKDLIVTEAEGVYLTVYQGSPAGTSVLQNVLGPATNGQLSTSFSEYTGSSLGDFDHDGDEDALIRSSQKLRIYRSGPAGLEDAPSWERDFGNPLGNPNGDGGSVAVSEPADFNADGVTDLAVGLMRYGANDPGRVAWVSFGADGDYDNVYTPEDCDDADPHTFPATGTRSAAPERCDGKDNDCNGIADDGVPKVPMYPDADLDDYGDADADAVSHCIPIPTWVSGLSTRAGDCEDGDAHIYPGATEACNGDDDDCDGQVDEGLDVVYYADDDDDGFGDDDAPTTTLCKTDTVPALLAADPGDCDDDDASIKPGGVEVCNAKDDDCDGTPDDGLQVTYYRDADGDGFGRDALPTTACETDPIPEGYAALGGDCADGDAAVNPNANEVCDAGNIDENCNGTYDNSDATVLSATRMLFFPDADADTYGAATATGIAACDPPFPGWIANSLDCDDDRPAAHPAATETVGNGLDENCDGRELCYIDQDRDAARTTSTVLSVDATCSTAEREALASAAVDCDDASAARTPGATDIPYDGIDQDCSGADLVDGDGDGEASADFGGADCNDNNPNVAPGLPEIANGGDDDCDGELDEGTAFADDDGDGRSERGGDCDDDNPTIPGVERCNGVDDNCDGRVDEGTPCADDDGDGVTEVDGDCNDDNPGIRPTAAERRNGLDDDCDGETDEGFLDADDDGVSSEQGDCDDADPTRFPGATETVDEVDQDCDGTVDEGTVAYDDDDDGYSENDGDCDDRNGFVAPNRVEIADLLDNDCDGFADDLPAAPRAEATLDEYGASGCNQGGSAPTLVSALVAAAMLRRPRQRR